MNVVLAVVVYDRFDNIREWVRSWNQCEKEGAQLVIIHNYANEADRESYTEFCQTTGIGYIPRVNVGFDIGAFQDVCRNRLEGFPEYDYLLWCCDDLKIMQKDFIKKYTDLMQKYDVVAMDISKSVRPHIRTTGFMIKKEVAERLQFPADPVTLKEQCYQFEHRAVKGTFLQQVIDMGYRASKVCGDPQSAPFWDTGFKKMRNRHKEYLKVFPMPSQSEKKATIICLIYNQYPEILASMINQTHKNWHLVLIHDGKATMDIKSIVEAANDPRVTYIETEERKQSWGHYWRGWALKEMKEGRLSKDSAYVCIGNADNHLVPVFLEYLIKGLENNDTAIAAYCNQMSHSYVAWNIIRCKPSQGYIDSMGVLVKTSAATKVGWNHTEDHSADWLYFRDLMIEYGKESFVEVPGMLLVHN